MIKMHSLTVDHIFDSSPAELWAAWTDPQQFRTWYNPAPGMDLDVHAFDVRVGGAIHFEMPMPGGRRGPATKGIFHVVEPNKRLVFGAADKTSLNDVTFAPVGKKTKVTVVWSSATPEMATPDMQNMARTAWKSSAAKLERLLAAH